jgi:hypothetical protein
MSNSVQLKHVLKQGSSHSFYSTQVILGIISVFMCGCIGKLKILLVLFFLRVSFFICSNKVVVVTTFPSRILGLIQVYIYLFTRLDYLPFLSSSSVANLTRYEQLIIILPDTLILFLFLFNLTFLIIMFKF